jgi:hypothetical protein
MLGAFQKKNPAWKKFAVGEIEAAGKRAIAVALDLIYQK